MFLGKESEASEIVASSRTELLRAIVVSLSFNATHWHQGVCSCGSLFMSECKLVTLPLNVNPG